MSFLEQLVHHYRERGYEVYCKHMAGLKSRPSDWKGVIPDLIAEKPGRRIAVFLETTKNLRDPLTPDRWRDAVGENHAVLQLFVQRQSDKLPLEQLLEKEGIEGEVGLVRKETSRRRVSTLPRRRWMRIALGLFVIVTFCYLLVWLGSLLYDYQADYYEPRDMEREEEPQ